MKAEEERSEQDKQNLQQSNGSRASHGYSYSPRSKTETVTDVL
jgi:hypothetical protein